MLIIVKGPKTVLKEVTLGKIKAHLFIHGAISAMNYERTGSSVLERFLDPLPGHFWTHPQAPPPLVNFVHGSCMLDMDIVDHVAAALGLSLVLAAELGPESVLTNLTRGRRARPPISLS